MLLRDLIQRILIDGGEDDVRFKLSYDFDIGVPLLNESDKVADEEQLVEKITQLASTLSPKKLVTALLSHRALRTLLKQKAGSNLKEELVESLLDAWGVPRIPRRPGPERIVAAVREKREEADKIVKALRGMPNTQGGVVSLRAISLDCWTYIEELLKQVLWFYAFHFTSRSMTDELKEAFFRVCSNRKSLGALLDAMSEVEYMFERGETSSRTRERTKLRSLKISRDELKNPGPVARTQSDDLAEDPADALAREVAIQLQKECLETFGRKSPWPSQTVDIEELKRLKNIFRNPSAHEMPESLVPQDPTGERTRESLAWLLSFAEQIRDEIAPRLIFLVAKGRDAYGRDILFYIGEGAVERGDAPPDLLGRAEYFFCKPRDSIAFSPFEVFLLWDRLKYPKAMPPAYRYEDVVRAFSTPAKETIMTNGDKDER
jgi:hypothetical protein